jgi:hypothetical protein
MFSEGVETESENVEEGSSVEGKSGEQVEVKEKVDNIFSSLFKDDYPSDNNYRFEKNEIGEVKKVDEIPPKNIIESIFDSLFSDDFANGLTDNRNEKSVKDSGEALETRELTEEEKAEVQAKTGWTDDQMKKCTIDENGVIHYKCDRDDLDGKTHETAGVPYERRIADINGVKVEVVVPKFNSKFDCKLPDNLLKESNAKQFDNCNAQLKEALQKDPELRKQFTEDQIEDILNGDTPEGYTWHHDAESGKMQLVATKEHDRTQGGAAHTGGKALWGGGY